VRFPFPQWDEGTAGGFSTGVPGLVAGVSGLLPDEKGALTEAYNDMLGLVLLQAKNGLTVAAAMMRLLKRRGFEEFYFCGTDAVASNVGYATGAIAYFRKEYEQLLIFAIRCMGHISSRTLRHMLTPDRISFDELSQEGYELAPPEDCPLPADSGSLPSKIPRFLLDLGDVKLRLDCAISETIGDRFFSGHLSFVEKRHFGIFFEAHDEIERHRQVCSLFGDEDEPWRIDAVAELKPSFARGLSFVEKYAQRHEDVLADAVGFVRRRVDEKMSAYSDYYHDQTEEWFTNPAFVIGRLGSKKSGRQPA